MNDFTDEQLITAVEEAAEAVKWGKLLTCPECGLPVVVYQRPNRAIIPTCIVPGHCPPQGPYDIYIPGWALLAPDEIHNFITGSKSDQETLFNRLQARIKGEHYTTEEERTLFNQ